MPKKIVVRTERWCCEPEDLKPKIGAKLNYKHCYDEVFCVHCGQRFEFYTFTDAAGSTDWNYREAKS